VVEGARLESVYTATYRGFESLPHRHKTILIPEHWLFLSASINTRGPLDGGALTARGLAFNLQNATLGGDMAFVPFTFDRLAPILNSGQIDLAMSCIAALPDRYASASFSSAYLNLTLAFVVRDHERHSYDDIDTLQSKNDLTFALACSHYFEPYIRTVLTNAHYCFP
jgi:hypothetical protein